jgi:maltose alpha-D-glucosyltransferase/alpha-amylase
MLLGEANQWPEDAVKYFGSGRGDECHMAFHFPLMPRLFMALRMEDRLPIVDILEQTPPIPETSQWALFLRNHDELTLEMVTDEERDYMYRMYAQVHKARLNLGIRRRLAPLLNNDRKSIELLNALLFSLPGTPVLYYGDEIGLGENIYLGDRNGVRTPMQWSPDKNAGFSRANPQSLYLPIILDPAYHYEANNVEAQLANPHSLLWWMRRMLALRKRWRALGEGKCEFLQPDNHRILTYVLRHEKETILVVANLSRFTQPVQLDLSSFRDLVPVELFGRTRFPAITDAPYFFTLGPHNFYWFSLEAKPLPLPASADPELPQALPALTVEQDWQEVFRDKPRARLEALLPDFFKRQPWFVNRNKTIKQIMLKEHFPVSLPDAGLAALAFCQVEYVDAPPEVYALPLGFARDDAPPGWREHAIADLSLAGGSYTGRLYDALANPDFSRALFDLVRERQSVRNTHGALEGFRTPAMRQALNSDPLPAPFVEITSEGNCTVLFGEKAVLKFFRRLGQGENPEFEIGHFLTEREFPHSPRVLGKLEYLGDEGSQMTVAVARSYVTYAKNAWKFTLDAVNRYYDRVFTAAIEGLAPDAPPVSTPLTPANEKVARQAADYVGVYLETVRQLGVRTGELHLALASGPAGGEFTVEPMTPHYLRGVFQSMRSTLTHNLRLLRKQLKTLPADLLPAAQRVIELEPVILQQYRPLIEQRFDAGRIRIHGDLHLGQILWTGRDFVFLDFEGETFAPISERRIKRSALRDVARMLRSFHHAAYAGFRLHADLGGIAHEDLPKFEPWIRHWNHTVSRAYLQAYYETVGPSGIVPVDEGSRHKMFLAYLLNQVVDELGRELRAHSENVRAPLRAILHLLDEH